MFYIAQLTNALVIGTLYALMATGLSLIFGVLKLVNFSHGEALMVGGYVYYYLSTLFGVPPIVALLSTMPLLFGFGILLELTMLRPAYERSMARFDEYVILATFAMGLFLQNLALPLLGPYNRQPRAIFTGRMRVGDLVVSGDRIAAALIALIVIVALFLFLRYSTWGKGLRAVSQNPTAAAIISIDVPKMRSFAFGLGTTLAGIAGALLGPVFLVNPGMGNGFAVKAFVIVVLGGMGSLAGSVIGAYLLALVESLGSVLIPDMSRALAYKDAYGLLLLILVLLLRPQGLLGEKLRSA